MSSTSRDRLQKLILDEVIVHSYRADPTDPLEQPRWIFDFRKILLQPAALELITEVLYETIADLDAFQIAGMESAAIPLVTSLVSKAYRAGKHVNGLYVRKSRKKSGLYKIIEGAPNQHPVVLVDDLMNSGGSMQKQHDQLVAAGLQVVRIITLVQFRTTEAYQYFHEQAVDVQTIFTLTDFSLTLPEQERQRANFSPYEIIWQQAVTTTAPQVVVRRSTPVVTNNMLLYGADDRTFRARDQQTGAEVWSYVCGRPAGGKSILSAPAVDDTTVYFGTYDGRLQALDLSTGEPRWVVQLADWIGSSPAMGSDDSGLVFIGLEFADPTARGGIAAVKRTDGTTVWLHRFPALTHATPLYIEQFDQVFVGGNEGRLYAFTAATGTLLWQFETEGGAFYLGGGFGRGDIKSAPVYDAPTDSIAFSSYDGHVYVLDRATGQMRYRTQTPYEDTTIPISIWSEPLFTEQTLIYSGLDKFVYGYDKKTGKRIWQTETGGRIFSAPRLHQGRVYVGANDGVLYCLDEGSGSILRRYQFPDRLVCPPVFSETDPTLVYLLTGNTTLYAVRLME